MNEEGVFELERRLGFRLPDDYRHFLVAHVDSLLEPAIAFREPRQGIIDELLTVDQILDNDEKNMIGIPEKSLLHIGGNLMGGCLYLKVSREGFGEVHYLEQYEFRDSFVSFTAFLDETVQTAKKRVHR
jgi:hypothetical protein